MEKLKQQVVQMVLKLQVVLHVNQVMPLFKIMLLQMEMYQDQQILVKKLKIVQMQVLILMVVNNVYIIMITLLLMVLLLIIKNVLLKELMMVLNLIDVLLLMMLVNVKYVNLDILKIKQVCVYLLKLIFVKINITNKIRLHQKCLMVRQTPLYN